MRRFLQKLSVVAVVLLAVAPALSSPGLIQLTDDPATDCDPAWSPTGQQIAFTSFRGPSGTWILDLPSMSVRFLTSNQCAAWSPDGSQVAVNGIYVLNADGSGGPRFLAPGGFPSWCPDGSRIAFDYAGDIRVVNADGSGLVSITPGGGWDRAPAWSPDGSRIAFISDRIGPYRIWTVAPDGTDLRQVVEGTSYYGEPAWTPDATHISYERTYNVWIVAADGTGDRRLTNGGGMDGSFSPDGTQFVFTSGRSGNADLWVMNASEITPSVPCPERPPSDPYPLVIRQLTSWPDTSFISDAAGINYDGSRVAIESGAPLTGGSPPPGGGDDVFGVYGDGTGMRRLTYGARGTAVMMSGNGEMIVYHGRGNITGQNADGSDEVFVVSFDGTIMRQLTFNPISLYECPGTRISHDGQWVAFRSNADLTGENADHNYEAFVVRSDGTGLKQLSNEPNAAYSVWGIMLSRDGQKVAFGSTSDFLGTNTDHSREVFIINRDGTGLAQVTDNPDPVTYFDIGYGITWAGDTLLIYGTADPTGQNPDGHSQMFMVNSDGTNLRQLTCDPYFDSTMGMLSYDGTIVTFRSRADFTGQNPDHSNEVFMIRSDGTRLTQVSRFDGPGSGSCLDRPSGDGRHIAFTSNGNQTGQNPDLGSEGFIADIANTPAGNNVEVEPGAAVEMTFGEVTSPGNTTASASTTPPAEPPSGFSLLGNYYDISTTATYAGPITVSIPYDPAAVPPGHEGELRLFHWDAIANQWQDVTTGVDTVNHRVIGAVTSLSWLAVGFPLYQWQGFLPPVDNPPVFNAAKAGRTIPVKWQLKDANGAFVSSLSVVVYNPLRYRQIGDDGAPVDPLPTDATIAGAAGLRYDSAAKQFIFNWKTSSAFAGKCYELLLDLDDGTQKAARFKFTR